MPVIDVRDLVKEYPGKRAVDGLSFRVEPGEVYGLLGENVVSRIFPLRPFVDSMQRAFNPTVDAPAFNWSNLGVLAAWGAVGVLLAWRFFKWEPVAGDGTSTQRSRRRGRRVKPSGE